jgi:hypothetical protein
MPEMKAYGPRLDGTVPAWVLITIIPTIYDTLLYLYRDVTLWRQLCTAPWCHGGLQRPMLP